MFASHTFFHVIKISRADEGARFLNLLHGKQILYQLSYIRINGASKRIRTVIRALEGPYPTFERYSQGELTYRFIKPGLVLVLELFTFIAATVYLLIVRKNKGECRQLMSDKLAVLASTAKA